MKKIIVLPILIFLISITTWGQISDMPDTIEIKREQGKVKFTIVEKQPEYPGGLEEFYRYISKNLKYPKTAKKNGVAGKVYVEFVVNNDGSIDDESIRIVAADELTKLGRNYKNLIEVKECDLEAVRLVQECSDWKPAMQKGIPVRVKMIVPITFKL